ncbi:ribosomal protein L11 methyltransferase [Nonlabens tegetincola]|uniref:50S ribosomal protein L11 methyltransferase n=1 Tax=Nonlabens tegetincola TaxID=323273 RepID=UPI000A203E29|nr:50S ribosomal protein L11 methyltransferase [Nonlabens tegetincola]ARN70515.1 ribosomal protein L11 methyltransferase [Nonlabens tegetincola]
MANNITNQIYVEYDFTVTPREPWSDILCAQLGDAGFESFIDTQSGVKAYILKDLDSDNVLSTVDLINSDYCDIAFAKADIPPTNWNAEWEKNFTPILVNDQCLIRAPFHESKEVKYEIVMEPKMSFGTGHHQTTYMMIQFLLKEELAGKKVLDMGSGTGVLAILAQMRGATLVDAIDIDTWCFENAQENTERNNADKVNVILGGAEQLAGKQYDFIIANINRNILLQDIPKYAASLKNGGSIIFSGFYTQDLPLINEACSKVGLTYETHIEKDNWVGLKANK